MLYVVAPLITHKSTACIIPSTELSFKICDLKPRNTINVIKLRRTKCLPDASGENIHHPRLSTKLTVRLCMKPRDPQTSSGLTPPRPFRSRRRPMKRSQIRGLTSVDLVNQQPMVVVNGWQHTVQYLFFRCRCDGFVQIRRSKMISFHWFFELGVILPCLSTVIYYYKVKTSPIPRSPISLSLPNSRPASSAASFQF